MRAGKVTRLLESLSEAHETLIAEFIPAGARSHFLASHREALLGLRSLLDAAIDRAKEPPEASGKKSPPSRSRGVIDISD
ncbi:hypothetical protein AV654_16855 [Paenibacillus elgii]|uniref:Uncharacterized protein n=1 Tax=Paenibacillus elgii TaxID=189691 RepID=A0A161S3S4_9BACL|nr:hypothetical protein [Paenibacillus elgii]KZE79149.1 hypothetical protein AV654_16855 [Paenibacillus elgii]